MRPVRQLIDQRLVARARHMGALTDCLRQLLPPALAPHCRVSGTLQGVLILAADGAAWATQLRYLQREIVKHMNAHLGLGLSKVRIQISPPARGARQSGQPDTLRRPVVPRSAGEILRQTASSVDDPQLAQALERLARRAGQGPRRR